MHWLSSVGYKKNWKNWELKKLVHWLSSAGSRAGLAGALAGAGGLGNEAAEVAVIRCQINVRPELDALLK